VITNCVFCGSTKLTPAFSRSDREFVRCSECRAYLQSQRSSDPEEFEDGSFTQRTLRARGEEPAFDTFDYISPMLVTGSRLLEIGSGTGHLLAAAKLKGFAITGIETSPYQRALIQRRWGIETIGEPIETAQLCACTYDNAIGINVIEHISEPEIHLRAVARVLKPGGRYFISTCNADCLVAALCGRYWSMFKPADHLSIPSPESLRRCATISGLLPMRIWCSEYPLDTPLGVLLGVRDWLSERRHQSNRAHMATSAPRVGRDLTRTLVEAKMFRFVAAVFSKLMIAGSVKALLEKPAE
jgi:SAM-dependent methyltransferase